MPPAVSDVRPRQGARAGGTPVTVTGTGLTGATSVSFGARQATDVVVVSDTRITARTPPGTGTVNVTVTGPGGSSPDVVPYTYVEFDIPAITALVPDHGPVSGGTVVSVTGSGFAGATRVDFGGVPAAFTVLSGTLISAVAPPSPGPSAVVVTVTGPGGVSDPAAFAYQQTPPAVTGVLPDQGPAGGGNTVTVTGTALSGATVVRFGEEAAPSFTVEDDTRITAVAPPGEGVVDVTVTTPSGTSAPGPGSAYTYVDVPVVLSLSPDHGPAAGGTSVTIGGSGFTYAVDVLFGGVPAPFSIVSDTLIVARSPGGAGQVEVVVATAAGPSAGVPFTYV
jgi:hypothetical protein